MNCTQADQIPPADPSACTLEARYVAVERSSGKVLGLACERHVQRLVDSAARSGVSIMHCAQYYTAPRPAPVRLPRRRGRFG